MKLITFKMSGAICMGCSRVMWRNDKAFCFNFIGYGDKKYLCFECVDKMGKEKDEHKPT